jgi:hypothetical protein
MAFGGIKKKIARRIANAILRSAGCARLYSAPGDFYSPIVDPDEAFEYLKTACRSGDRLDGFPRIEEAAMLQTSAALNAHFPYIQTFLGKSRYSVSHTFFNLGDAYIFSAFILNLKPKRIIEVGSGFSSACALDTADAAGLDTDFVFIDPYPERLYGLLSAADKSRTIVYESGVQKVELSLFDGLLANDILFLDTTHVCKTGSDVNHELFYILPRLKSGVYIHFHDMFNKWEYPDNWISPQNRSWNEIYAVRALLMYNNEFEIVYFNDYVWREHPEWVGETWMEKMAQPGSGLYLRKK